MKFIFRDYLYKKTVNVVINKIIPFRGYAAINLFGVIFIRKEYESYATNETLIRHELIHTKQMRELLYIGFYILYIAMWLRLLIKYRNLNIAYKEIPFEKEANYEENNQYYLHGRRKYNWRYYA